MSMTRPVVDKAQRQQYSTDRLETASNARILVLCFDRLDRDLAQARAAIDDADHFVANDTLAHAQDLLGELAAMLDTEAWSHATTLLSVYDYILRLLAKANVLKSATLLAEAQTLIREIGDAFRTITLRPTEPSEPIDRPGVIGLSIQA
jgi:flagellar protein FliS